MTSAYYAVSPFVGALLSFVILGEQLQLIFAAASIVMAAGTYFAVKDSQLPFTYTYRNHT
jgi:drug/metabolite transporter (DMT)-like permease